MLKLISIGHLVLSCLALFLFFFMLLQAPFSLLDPIGNKLAHLANFMGYPGILILLSIFVCTYYIFALCVLIAL